MRRPVIAWFSKRPAAEARQKCPRHRRCLEDGYNLPEFDRENATFASGIETLSAFFVKRRPWRTDTRFVIADLNAL
jgi:hypothetical protein